MQLYEAHQYSSSFYNIHFNNMLQSIHRSSNWSVFLRFSHQSTACIFLLPLTCHVSQPSHSSWFDRPNKFRWGVQITMLTFVLSIHLSVTSFLRGPNTFLKTLFWNPFSLCFSLNVKDQFSNACKKTGKIIFMHILNIMLCIESWKTQDSGTDGSRKFLSPVCC